MPKDRTIMNDELRPICDKTLRNTTTYFSQVSWLPGRDSYEVIQKHEAGSQAPALVWWNLTDTKMLRLRPEALA
jgi:hypothetical protein